MMTLMVSLAYAVNEGRLMLMENVSPASIIRVIGGSSHAVHRSIVSTGSYRSRMLQDGIWLVIVIAAFVHIIDKSESQRLFVGGSVRDDIRLWVVYIRRHDASGVCQHRSPKKSSRKSFHLGQRSDKDCSCGPADSILYLSILP